MTSAVLNAAEAALSIEDRVAEGAAGVDGALDERKATHWSYKLFIAGTVIGVIAAVAAYILGFHAIAVTGTLLAVTNGFAAFYVKRFGILKTLEDHTGRLAQKVQDLKEVNNGLERITDGLQEIPDDWRREIKNGKREIQQKAKELGEMAAKLKATEAKLQKLASVTTDIQKRTGELSAEAVKFSQQNQLFGERVDRLAHGVNEVQKHNDDLASLIMETDANTDEYEELNQQFSQQLEMLDDLFELMKDLYVKAQQRMHDLESQVDELGLVVPKAVKSAAEAQQVHRQMEELQVSYDQVIIKLEKTLHTIQRYKKYKIAYKELAELKGSEKWPEIERLLSS